MEQRDGGPAEPASNSVAIPPEEIPLAQIEGLTRYRKLKEPGMRALQRLMLWAIPLFSLLFNFEVPSYLAAPMLQEQYLGIILILVLGSVFLSIPAAPGASQDEAPWYD